jgi:DNA-binding CsgD family transcriptional regulator
MYGLYLFEPKARYSEEIHLRRIPESFVFEYEELRRAGEPGYEWMIRSQKSISDTMVYPGRRWKRSALYRLNNKYRMRHYLCSPILLGDEVVGMLGLGRSSEAAPFDFRERLRAEVVCRILGQRLFELSKSKLRGEAPSEESGEPVGRLRAKRVRLRVDLDRWEEQAVPLPVEEAAVFWRALATNHAVPLDFFDLGSKRYVLLPLNAEVPEAKLAGSLTARELEIVGRVAAGDANKAIAFDLGLSMSTVASHLSSAIAKLGLDSRVRLIEKFCEWGFGVRDIGL